MELRNWGYLVKHGTMTVNGSWQSGDSGYGRDHRQGGKHSDYTFLLPSSHLPSLSIGQADLDAKN